MTEERIIKDENGLYHLQIRRLPVEEEEPNDGWCTECITEILELAIERMSGTGV